MEFPIKKCCGTDITVRLRENVMTDMVNRVNGNDYYDYTKLKMPDAADKAGSGDQFNLAYQRAQEEMDENDKKDKSDELDAVQTNRSRTVMQSGVKLELSGGTQALDADNNASQTGPAVQGLADTLRSWITTFVQAVKRILYRIWNDSPPTEDITSTDAVSMPDDTTEADEPERLSEEYLALKNLEELQNPEAAVARQIERGTEREKEIQKLLRSGDMERVISLVTENGQKTMAKNSTLLTYYDRSGRIAPLSASDQERILHGDRSTRKL